ncbi:hypothetical protein IDSA_10425 [Pseudidiomarina salinarum]|uniref:Tetratricopeptide repeat protein n=1 Tax=Pseudidiomarina salinarum TaxID=435908 RepID=A0A094L6U7_9GAMM|nr:tetratricopeptide repeat protein [Pseudidiomarina salinarum]KFZ30468.1 hypothetical protein IDSA_10425 [Pseudidiomarina salinarum]RUO68615.1 hypothetical protein CWI79_11125 [Pseudidiomarina salinarum]
MIVRILLVLMLALGMQSDLLAQDTKRTPALREQVYSQLALAQELADNGDVQAGLKALNNVESKLGSMNSYERAMLWNFYGFMHYSQDNIDKAVDYFARVVAEDPIPNSLRQNTLYSLAQLALGQGDYQAVLSYLDQWQQLAGDEQQSKALLLKAQALYQSEQYQPALSAISEAIKQVEAQQQIADENWYVLQRAIYFELGQTQKIADLLEKMVGYFNKPEYWTQLAGVYGQLGESKKQLAVLAAAHQQGYLTREQDIMSLAESYFFSDVPYQAALVLEKALANEQVTATPRALKMLAQSWVAAREIDEAVVALARAAEFSDDGELDAQRAQVLLSADRNDEAAEAARTALKKGGLKQPGTMYLLIGMAELNQENFNEALQAFSRAQEFDDVKKPAAQWHRYAEAEQEQAERLADLKASS